LADRPKILIVAPNANRIFGGEAFLPLIYFTLLHARGHSVRLVTHDRNRPSLTEYIPELADRIDYIDDSIFHRLVLKLGLRLPARLRDILTGPVMATMTEMAQRKIIRRLVANGQVEVIHQPIPVSPKQPSLVYGFGVPVVIGPMNGGMNFPKGYEDFESPLAARALSFARIAARALNWIWPGKRRAQILMVANARTRAALPMKHSRVVDLVENAVDLRTWTAPATRSTRAKGAPFRLVYVGRLVDWKCVDITLAAVERARASGVDVTLDILGDGPEMSSLRQRAQEIGDAVHLHGYQPQAVCAEVLASADALILNSIRECGGAVVLEAMALGLPVIASDWGGPADYLDPTCGILVHPEPRSSFVERLAAAILRLADDPELCQRMGKDGAAKVRREFDWQGKIDMIEKVYRDAIAIGPDR
jgi:glycosyltransferase involved in cell wall biosynthesis